jgi:hypothetical protein
MGLCGTVLLLYLSADIRQGNFSRQEGGCPYELAIILYFTSTPAGMAPRQLTQNYATYMAPVAAMYFAQQLDSENAWVINGVRAAFGVVLVLSLYTYILVHRKIEANNDQALVTYAAKGAKKKQKQNSVTSSVKEYELTVFSSEITKLLLGAFILLFMHVAFGAFTSLFIGCCTGPFTLFDSPLVKAHLLHEDLARPFTEPESIMAAVKSEITHMKAEYSNNASSSNTATLAAEAFRKTRGTNR